MMKALLKGPVLALALGILIAGCGSGNGNAGGGTTSTPPGPLGAPPCEEAGQRACNNHSNLFAIAHSFTDPQNTVLYRVNVAAWDLGTGWQGGRNGLFYLATVSGAGSICVNPNPQGSAACTTTKVYVPFNGVRFDASSQQPQLPAFSFIVPVTGGNSSTTVTIEACFTNYEGSSFDSQPPCTDLNLGWSDVYSSLPTPAVGLPSGFSSDTVAELVDTTTASIPSTGVYPGMLTVRPSDTLDDTGLDFFYDHLVFLDENGNPYTNDIFDGSSSEHRSMGVLTIGQAAYPVSDTEYRTKYGNMQTLQGVALPDERLFFYTADEISSTAIKVGIAYIYDGASGCSGDIGGVGSNDPDCNVLRAAGRGTAAALPSFGTAASITPVSSAGNEIQPSQESGLTAGEREHRTVLFGSPGGGLCPRVVNPLATALGGGYYGTPNYVIRHTIDDARAWGRDFPNAMYFVLPTAFGNCNTTDAPFCQRTSGTTSYDAYVPHYLNTANTSTETLNGGSTSAAVVGGFTLADEYTLGNAGQASENSLVYFDNCGYGYLYSEGGDSGVTLGTRKTLPDAPDSGDTYTYQITNDLDRPVVFGKECCASFYQQNTDDLGNTYLEPPVELDSGFGVFVGAGETVTYDTLFNDEATIVYDATTGERLFKMRLNGNDPAVYSCVDYGAEVKVSTLSSTHFSVDIGSGASDAQTCQSIGECPFGTQAGLLAGQVTCTLPASSSFLLGVADWVGELGSSVKAIQFRTWGAEGRSKTGNDGGKGGFAMTVVAPQDLTPLSNDYTGSLYAYVGHHPDSASYGGSSTVLMTKPLSSLTDPENVTLPDENGFLLIAGGGGGAGDGAKGGRGADAIPTTSAAASVAGDKGNHPTGADGGQGGNPDGIGSGAGSGNDGVGGYGGPNVDWAGGGSLVRPKSWNAGKGADVKGSGDTGGAGGGGFGGGDNGTVSGGDNPEGAGGGGGGSWARRNTATDSQAPTLDNVPDSPNGAEGGLQIVYGQGATDATVSCHTETVGSRVNGVCDMIGGSSLDLNTLPAIFDADPDSIIWIEAWGGNGAGGDGHGAYSGGNGGPSGYAQTITSIPDVQSAHGTTVLHVYLGAKGSNDHRAGKGGSSTIVATADLTKSTPALGTNVLLVAAGGGGGSEGTTAHNGKNGGHGGRAIATTAGNGSDCGEDGGESSGSAKPGRGGCNGTGGGGGGSNENRDGHDGIGGFGGSVHAGGDQSSPQGWANTTPTKIGDNGRGGNGGGGGDGNGGSGGGGYGGGGGGNGSSSGSDKAGGGGGGGGSWAIKSTRSDGNAPTSRPDPGSSEGVLRIVFPNLP